MFQQLSYFQMITLTFIFVINLYTFGLFYIDKQRAVKRKYRISEKHLILSSFIGGGIGSFTAMYRFRHKIQKPLFKLGVPVAALLTLLIILLILL